MSADTYDFYLNPIENNYVLNGHSLISDFTSSHFSYVKTLKHLSGNKVDQHQKIVEELKRYGPIQQVCESQDLIFIVFTSGKVVSLEYTLKKNLNLTDPEAENSIDVGASGNNNTNSSSTPAANRRSSNNRNNRRPVGQIDSNGDALPPPPSQETMDSVPLALILQLEAFMGQGFSLETYRFCLARRRNNLELAMNDILDGNIDAGETLVHDTDVEESSDEESVGEENTYVIYDDLQDPNTQAVETVENWTSQTVYDLDVKQAKFLKNIALFTKLNYLELDSSVTRVELAASNNLLFIASQTESQIESQEGVNKLEIKRIEDRKITLEFTLNLESSIEKMVSNHMLTVILS